MYVPDDWFANQIGPLATINNNLLVSSYNTKLTESELATLDSSYSVFIGLQAIDHRLVTPFLSSLFVSN